MSSSGFAGWNLKSSLHLFVQRNLDVGVWRSGEKWGDTRDVFFFLVFYFTPAKTNSSNNPSLLSTPAGRHQITTLKAQARKDACH